ncbi:pyridoxamine 5'-phosphate oxidase family protein [Roseateles amylovorans]|uniref:Pyridoxamine 5'-phosphate oxidase family protein n=1 Tax=Roseateles amylovorans TaxID=2978473 RepID=A0ABY6B7A4_9BURK|nr:pyridoxamine 5'-phosphate oxidase family protein [Roseateles amylovorans]UXH80340.1 pyridoxamine 5'-phosphate oxidase family protein [Roseateles amylovorans]
MDSINRQQPEENRKDLSGAEAIERVRSAIKKNQSCFFCTSASTSDSATTRPMGALEVDDAGRMWFMSASDSHKNAEIAQDPNVRLYFQATEHSGFMALDGRATVSRDPAKIDELWSPLMKTWFTEGKDDPRITTIAVQLVSGYYWDNKHGDLVAGAKMAIGAAIGKTLDDSIEGVLRF